jgi:fumarate reductase subunit D
MAIAKKAFVWGLFAAGGTVSSFIYPALIALFLMAALGYVPVGLRYENIHSFAENGFAKAGLLIVVSLAMWHSAHRLRVVFHDFGVRLDTAVANILYLLAFAGTVITAFYLYRI